MASPRGVFLVGPEAQRSLRWAVAVGVGEGDVPGACATAGPQERAKDDLELQALAAVHGQHLHGVLVGLESELAPLGRDGLAVSAFMLNPLDERFGG